MGDPKTKWSWAGNKKTPGPHIPKKAANGGWRSIKLFDVVGLIPLPSRRLTYTLKNGVWKTFLLGRPIFRGYVSLSTIPKKSPKDQPLQCQPFVKSPTVWVGRSDL